MADNDDVEHISTDRARAGATPGVARVALVGGLVLVIVAFAAIYLLT